MTEAPVHLAKAWTHDHSLCGRNGYRMTVDPELVTCKLCLRILAAQDRTDAEELREDKAELHRRLDCLATDYEDLREALDGLAEAEELYRKSHDLHGDGHSMTGRAWDRMRRAGDHARELLTRISSLEKKGS